MERLSISGIVLMRGLRARPVCSNRGRQKRSAPYAMVKTIARAFRWRALLEQGEYATVRELATSEKINETYVGRVLRMTLLAPEIIEAVLAGKQETTLRLDVLMRRLPVEWKQQRESLAPKV